jgi:hypothetical protein
MTTLCVWGMLVAMFRSFRHIVGVFVVVAAAAISVAT